MQLFLKTKIIFFVEKLYFCGTITNEEVWFRHMSLSEKIRCRAYELGFDLCGVAACRPLTERCDDFQRWLDSGYDGGLEYLKRNVQKRFDPSLLFEQARSVIVCGVSYNRLPSVGEVSSRIATYAHTVDYHITIKQQLFRLFDYLKELDPQASGRVFTDTAPISEKSWAVEAGLGWIGRHSLLVHPRLGSFLLLGEIVTTVQLDPDETKMRDGCGNCRRCVEACPTQAILVDRKIDAGKCIARRTIERENGEETEGDLHGWVFGCDVCQRVCPYNSKAPILDHEQFRPIPELEQLDAVSWLALDDSDFDRLFGKTPLARCGLRRLQDRIRKMVNKDSK